MDKTKLQDSLERDMDIARGAMIEIIENNRQLGKDIFNTIKDADYNLLEEYASITKNILDASKLLTDIHSAKPKTLKDIDSITVPKEKINLDDLID